MFGTVNLPICTSCSLWMLSITLCITRKSLNIIQDCAALWSKMANNSGRPRNLSCAVKDDSLSKDSRIKSEWPFATKFDPTAVGFLFVWTKCRNCDGITSMSQVWQWSLQTRPSNVYSKQKMLAYNKTEHHFVWYPKNIEYNEIQQK